MFSSGTDAWKTDVNFFSTMALWHIVKCVAIFQRHPDMKEKLFSQPAHG